MKGSSRILGSYLFLWCAQISGLISSDKLSVLCLAVLLLMSLYYTIKVGLSARNKFLRSLLFLVVIFSIYGFYFILFGDQLYISVTGRPIKSREYIMSIYQSLLPFFVFYYFAKRGVLTIDYMQKWAKYIFIVIVLAFIKNHNSSSIDSSVDHITNNGGYNFLALFPLLAFDTKKKLIQHIYFIICILFIIFSFKRGAIITSILAYSWFIFSTSNSSVQGRIRMLLLLSLLCIIIYNVFQQLLTSNEYFLSRFQDTLEGNTSGRDIIFSTLLNSYAYDSTLIEQIFGRGAYGTLKISHNVAHNDWLELLVDLGILGVISYFIYWWRLVASWIRTKGTYLYAPLGMFIIIFFCKTLFSMSYSSIPFFAMMALGYCIANLPVSKRTSQYL